MRLFATLVLPEKGKTTLNHVWQVGPSVTDGFPAKHGFQPANLNSKGTFDLLSGESKSSASGDSRVTRKNVSFSDPYLTLILANLTVKYCLRMDLTWPIFLVNADFFFM